MVMVWVDNKKNLFIGVDPGSKETGYFVLSRDQFGNLEAVSGGTIVLNGFLNDRLFELYEFFINFFSKIDSEKHVKVFVCVESPFVGRNVRSAFILTSVKSLLMVLSRKFCFDYLELSPLKIRKILCGFGGVDKEMVYAFLSTVLQNTGFSSAHESDAAAVSFASAFLAF
jgi:crossover junction endodeoxyribonuclease RuvC